MASAWTSVSTLLHRFETLEYAKKEQERALKHLRLARAKKAKRLVEKLAACQGGTPCRSGACPVCMRAYRIHWTQAACQLLGLFPLVLRASLIQQGARHELGTLDAFDLKRTVASLRTALSRVLPPSAVVLGGADVSLNSWNNSDLHWCVHLYLLLGCPSSAGRGKKYKAAVRAAISGADVAVPYLFRQVRPGELGKAGSYALKAQFYHRSDFGSDAPSVGEKKSKPAHQRLRGEPWTEALLFMDKHRLGDRLLLIGVKRYGKPERPVFRRV